MSTAVKILSIAWTNLVRTARDRLGLFFIVLMPMIIIVTLGLTYGGQGSARVGVIDAGAGPLGTELEKAIAASDQLTIDLRHYTTMDELRDASARGFVQFAIAIPAGYDADLRAGRDVSIVYLAPPTTGASAVRSTVERAVAAQTALVRAVRFAQAARDIPFDAALAAARSASAGAPGVDVRVESVATASATAANGFSLGAQSQVVLFMFLTSLVGAAELVTTRQLGVARRMLASPTGAWTIIAGEGLGRIALALFQGAFIALASALLFSVTWGDPAATIAIIVVFSFVGAGAALLVGSIASNASQAGALGPALGLLLALLGGAMVPIEVFPSIMQSVARATPHAWAIEAFRDVLLRGATIVDILPNLAVLAGFGFVLSALAVFRFRRVLLAGA